MMRDGMGGMIWGMGRFGLLITAIVALAVASLIKYLMSKRK